ncbi:MAG: metallophosphoesterase [Clostridia bacterium]|nr:metallophosphoesterase [Clostridia bacterium]
MRRNRAIFAEAAPRRMGWLAYPLLLLLIIAVSIALNFINNGRVNVEQVNVTVTSLPKDLEKFRILHISDLHGNEFGPNQSTISTMLKTQRYQAVCISGDVCAPDGSYDAFIKLIDLFPSIPVYFVAGDEDPEPILTTPHEGENVKADYIREAEAHGAIYLDHPEKLDVGKSTIWFMPETIYGLDISSARLAYQTRWNALVADHPVMTPETEAQLYAIAYRLDVLDATEESLKEIQVGDVQVALTHYPLSDETITTLQQWSGMEQDQFFRSVSLVLAGHYNAGQLRIPLLGAVREPQSLGGRWFPGDRQLVGLSTVQGVTQYISPGLGVSDIYPIRFRMFNTPAVTVLTLTSTLSF